MSWQYRSATQGLGNSKCYSTTFSPLHFTSAQRQTKQSPWIAVHPVAVLSRECVLSFWLTEGGETLDAAPAPVSFGL
jgi:hypothetical protein